MGSRTDLPWTYDSIGDTEVSSNIKEERARKVYEIAKESVTQNPIANPRSRLLRGGRYKGMYRWKKTLHNPYRLIYGAKKETRTVYPAIFDNRGNLKY